MIYTTGTPVDHSPIKNISIEIGGRLINLYGNIPQTRSRHYNAIRWDISKLENELYKDFDILIFYCINRDEKIERIYIFPKEEISKQKIISIIKNSSKGVQWYEAYRVTEEDEIRKIDKIFQDVRKKRRTINGK